MQTFFCLKDCLRQLMKGESSSNNECLVQLVNVPVKKNDCQFEVKQKEFMMMLMFWLSLTTSCFLCASHLRLSAAAIFYICKINEALMSFCFHLVSHNIINYSIFYLLLSFTPFSYINCCTRPPFHI